MIKISKKLSALLVVPVTAVSSGLASMTAGAQIDAGI